MFNNNENLLNKNINKFNKSRLTPILYSSIFVKTKAKTFYEKANISLSITYNSS